MKDLHTVTETADLPVVVVGAGPVGLAAAADDVQPVLPGIGVCSTTRVPTCC